LQRAREPESSERALRKLAEHRSILCCPRCRAGLEVRAAGLVCSGCARSFPIDAQIPQLFWPNEWDPSKPDVTEIVRAFYEETPFPNYDDFDSVASLARKAREGRFARLLDEQVPPGARILECGCGTGQLSNFLGIANRSVFGADLCLASLRLGEEFRARNEIEGVQFLQMNLFRPAFQEGSFDLVISNGVLHHTSDPRAACESIARLVRPGGYLLVGLYHRWGRLITDLRRSVFRLTGDRFTSLDPNLRDLGKAAAKRRAWFQDQYKHPHESKHTIGETIGWMRDMGFQFVKSLPPTRPFAPVPENEKLFAPEAPGGRIERSLAELGMALHGSREGGFFVVIARKPAGA
jgi:SAM-dependent methyltransferase